MNVVVRPGRLDTDVEACRTIYSDYVANSTVTLEYEPPSIEEFHTRMGNSIDWVVAEDLTEPAEVHGSVTSHSIREDGASQEDENRASVALPRTDSIYVAGFAYASVFRNRAAYDWTCESIIYLDKDFTGQGIGQRLYRNLLERLQGSGYRQVVSVITSENIASLSLHRSMGFSSVGTFKGVGWKHGRWHDVMWLQRSLGVGASEGPDPTPRARGCPPP